MENLSLVKDEDSCCESDEELTSLSAQPEVIKMELESKSFRESPNSLQIFLDDIPVETQTAIILNEECGEKTADRESQTESTLEQPQNMAATSLSSLSEERMRRKLQFFFMNPIEKWKAKRRFPYKFIVQVIKIVLVTLQLMLFASSRYNHVNYTWGNKVTFSHLFLKGWGPSMEIVAYPPGEGPLAIYQKDEFFETIDFAYRGYANLSNGIGPYSYPSENDTMTPLKLCFYRYREGTIFGFNESYVFNSAIDMSCVDLGDENEPFSETFETSKYLEANKIDVNFAALVKATLSFSVKTVNFKAAGPITPPDCYEFQIMITFDNSDHDGQMLLFLDAEPMRLICKGDIEYTTNNQIDLLLRSILNIFVILICGLSLVLCSRALYRATQLRITTVQFFQNFYNRELSAEGRFEFVNMWYIMIIINDLFIIIGSIIKEQIERKRFAGDQWNICSVCLGTGNLLVWFGVLRYIGFFKTYNVVILTLKKAAPKIFRFLVCAIIIYAGFTFAGWLILGPYHMKFRSLATTSECLFALINGDDMFATFSIMSGKSSMLWWYSRIYLYTFIMLYIYVVLSLFISVIMDAYDTIKKYYKDGFPKNDLQTFMGVTNVEDFSNGIYRSESSGSLGELVERFCCCSSQRCNIHSSNYSILERPRSPKNVPTQGGICV